MKNQGVATDYRKLPDEELIFRYVRREEPLAFNTLFDRYSHLVSGLCLKHMKNAETAKQATQQVFINLLDDLKRFEIESFKPWLYTFVLKYCHEQAKRPVKVAHNKAVFNEHMEFEEGWKQKIEEEELYGELEKAVATLNKEQKACIEMFYLRYMSYKEIAGEKGISMKQVKTLIQNGRRNIKEKLRTERNVQL